MISGRFLRVMTVSGLLAAAAPLSGALAAPAHTLTPAPQIGNAPVTPAVAPYDEPEKAPADVEAAFARARTNGKLVLLDFGGNWCPDCRILSGIFARPDVAAWLKENFEVVPVNVLRFTANMDIASRYGVKITSVPTVLIVTPEGKALNTDGSTALGNARRMSSQAVLDLIAQWASRS